MIKNHYVDRFGAAGCHSFFDTQVLRWLVLCHKVSLYFHGSIRSLNIIEIHLAFMV